MRDFPWIVLGDGALLAMQGLELLEMKLLEVK
jgi:hypothetical protein